MTESIVQRLRVAAAAPCLLPVPGVATVLGLGQRGLGLVFRDSIALVPGLVMALMALMAVMALGFTAGIMQMAWCWGSEWLLGWLSM